MSLSMTHRNQVEVVYVTIEIPGFCLFLYLTYISEASYSKLVTSVSKKSNVDQLELEK